MVRLYVFRHGQTDWNAEGRIQGHLDIELNSTGRSQACTLAHHMERLGIQAILSSDLSRALETARIAAQAAMIPVHVDPGLRETYFGHAQGLTREELRSRFGDSFFDRLKSEPLSDADALMLASETGTQIEARTLAAIRRFVHDHPSLERIGISTHGGVIRKFLQFVTRDPRFPSPVPNSSLFPITYQPKIDQWRLENFLTWHPAYSGLFDPGAKLPE